MRSSLICHGCGYVVSALDPRPFRCPNAAPGVDHVLVRRLEGADAAPFFDPEPDPFVRFRRFTHAWHVAMAIGMTDGEFVALARRAGFRETPVRREGELWIKDETANVAGSHKARHLIGLLLWLEVAQRIDPTLADARLAIASCGNAALAAAELARAAQRELDVFVPADAPEPVVRRLELLGAHVTRCQRTSEPGDPAYRRFREAVAGGAMPFSCQGNENGLVIEGGMTLGWELAAQVRSVDRLFIQTGGGALASAVIAALDEARALGVIEKLPRIHAVQTTASPLRRAWELLDGRGVDYAIAHRDDLMWPWETPPRSIAAGILDDETYDWIAVIRGMQQSGGHPIVVSEDDLREAAARAGDHVSATGAAGLAGWLAMRRRGELRDGETAAVLFTGAAELR